MCNIVFSNLLDLTFDLLTVKQKHTLMPSSEDTKNYGVTANSVSRYQNYSLGFITISILYNFNRTDSFEVGFSNESFNIN